MDLKAKAEIPRCSSGSGGAVAAGVVVVLRVVASLVMRVRFQIWEQISLCGPETVRKTHSSTSNTSSSSSGSGNWNRSRRRSSGKRVRE